jgi:hypothetical protein
MQTMAWILDEYSKFHGYSPAVVTGKPIVSSFCFSNFISMDIELRPVKAYKTIHFSLIYLFLFRTRILVDL